MLFNTEIQSLLSSFTVDGEPIDFAYLFYSGHAEKYIVYSQSDTTNSYSSDDNIAGVVAIYDFDIYSKSNYTAIAEGLKDLLKANGWTWQPTRDSSDFYEVDTGYYHKTFCFAKPLQIAN